MRQLCSIALGFGVLFVVASPSAGQTQPAPVYSLPPDGTWVEYDWVHSPPDGPETKGTLRISSVGRKEVGREGCRWVELRLTTGEGGDRRIRYRKLLLSEAAIKNGRSLSDATRECFDRSGDEVRGVTGKARLDFLGMAVRDAPLRVLSPSEEVPSKLGRYQARHLATDGSGPGRDYHGWLTAKVPFGWVRFEVRGPGDQGRERILFRAVAVRTGEGAVTQVDQSKANEAPCK
jgi:hypothetical protein